jgi:tetratricopeptide (TPR) repeat protein
MSVEGTLAGNVPTAKQIAQAIMTPYAFKKDPVGLGIRIQANTLREKLKKYQEEYGTAELVWIDLPRGAYKADFSFNPNSEVMKHMARAQAFKDRLVLGNRGASEEILGAINDEPNFVAGYPALVECIYLGDLLKELVLGSFQRVDEVTLAEYVKAMIDNAKKECQTALVSGGICTLRLRWDDARRYFESAKAIDPVKTQGSLWYALFLMVNGNFDEALKISKINLELYPSRDSVRLCHAFFMYLTRQKAGVTGEELQRIIGRNDEIRRARRTLEGYSAMAEGWYGGATSLFKGVLQDPAFYGNTKPQIGSLILCSSRQKKGFEDEAQRHPNEEKVEHAVEQANADHDLYLKSYEDGIDSVNGFQRIFFHMADGNGTKAITALRSACLNGHPIAAGLWLWPFLDDYRDHPRFVRLAKRLNIPEAQRIASERLISGRAGRER